MEIVAMPRTFVRSKFWCRSHVKHFLVVLGQFFVNSLLLTPKLKCLFVSNLNKVNILIEKSLAIFLRLWFSSINQCH